MDVCMCVFRKGVEGRSSREKRRMLSLLLYRYLKIINVYVSLFPLSGKWWGGVVHLVSLAAHAAGP